jgi:NTP pyrophosphatase (non-canonical NTP hydrolase)
MNLTFNTLRKANTARTLEWTGNSSNDSLLFRATELGGEAGEVLNAIKKFTRQQFGWSGGIDQDESIKAIAEELADVIICVDRVAAYLDINLNVAVKDKFNKTSDKYKLTVKINE